MRSLTDLLATDAGKDLLAQRGMHCDRDEFCRELRAPVDADLTTMVGLPPDALLVHIGQQVCTDYHPATASKYAAARQLTDAGVSPVVLWHDAYAAETERYGMRMVLPSGSKQVGVWLASKRLGAGEPRFIPVEADAVEQAMEALGKWVTHRMQEQPKDRRQDARARVERLADAVRSAEVATLGDFNAVISNYLLREALGVSLPSASLSTMLAAGQLTPSLDDYLARLDDVVVVFNEAVADLVAHDIDPQVAPLTDDYLPLRYACRQDGARLVLRHERVGADHFATATCRCGTEHRFHLGSRTLGLGELEATGRWSPDVSLPIHHRDVASGWIVGRSTALYGLVMNAVIARVLDARPIPGFVPPDLLEGSSSEPSEPSGVSLLVDHLTS